MTRYDFAAKAAYDALRNGPQALIDWEMLSEVDKECWRIVARKVQEATPAPFFCDIAIKTPAHGPSNHALHWHLHFGSSDEEIEQAGRDFVTKMKTMRDENY